MGFGEVCKHKVGIQMKGGASYHGGSFYKPRLHGPSANTTDLGGHGREGSGWKDDTQSEKAAVHHAHTLTCFITEEKLQVR